MSPRPTPATLPQPGLLPAVGLALGVIGLQTVLATPFVVIDAVAREVLHRSSLNLLKEPLVIAFVNFVAFGVPIGIALYVNRMTFWRAFPLAMPRVLQVLAILPAVVGCAILVSELDNVVRAVLPLPESLYRMMQEMFSFKGSLISEILLLVVAAPLTEELFFRGVVQRGLRWRYNTAGAIALAALLFGAVHLNPYQVGSAFVLGILFGWIYVQTGSIWLSVLAHAVANGSYMAVMHLSFEMPGLKPGDVYTPVEFQPIWLDAAGGVLLLLGLWLLRSASPPPDWELEQQRSSVPPVIDSTSTLDANQPPIIRL